LEKRRSIEQEQHFLYVSSENQWFIIIHILPQAVEYKIAKKTK